MPVGAEAAALLEGPDSVLDHAVELGVASGRVEEFQLEEHPTDLDHRGTAVTTSDRTH